MGSDYDEVDYALQLCNEYGNESPEDCGRWMYEYEQ
jgi:hypothetical protein